MLILVGFSAAFLAASQASISGPTDAFRSCLKAAASKAEGEKVAGDGIEDYFKAQCSSQMSSLKSAVIAFRVKNGMSRQTAAEDADMTVEDYMVSPADLYRLKAEMAGEAKPAAAAPPDKTEASQPQ